MLTDKMADALSYVALYQGQNGGRSPSYRQMAAALGLASTSGVHRLLRALEARGFIRREFGLARCIEVLRLPDSGWESLLAQISAAELRRELVRRETVAAHG